MVVAIKSIRLFTTLALFLYASSCAGNRKERPGEIKGDAANLTPASVVKDSFATGVVISPIACKSDPSQSYALYIPPGNANRVLPVIYFFDPHGNGSFPLKKYKSLADEYQFVLVGSNNSKNGNDWSQAEHIWNNLFNDAQNRLAVATNQVYACGFSGGARVAVYLALNHPEIKGIIANGAGMPDITSGRTSLNFSFTGVTGEGDLNMTELVSTMTALDQLKVRHRLLFFNGKHEWAPEDAMRIAFAGLQLDAMAQRVIPPNDTLIKKVARDSYERSDQYLKMQSFTKADREYKMLESVLDGLTDEVTAVKQKRAALKNDRTYQRQLRAEQDLLTTEEKLKESFGRQFQQGDITYWDSTIYGLQMNARRSTVQAAMYQRLLAYLSLAFYSFSSQLINSSHDQEARFYVDLYKRVDATNSEAWYYSAILNARNNNPKAAEDDLIKAVSNGFADRNRLRQQPEFRNAKIDISRVESKIKDN